MFLITVMPFFFPSVFHKMVACVIHQEGLWKTSRGKCLKCVRKAEKKDWSGKFFLSSRFFFGSFPGCKITYLKVVVEGWEIMWKTWLTIQTRALSLIPKHICNGSFSRSQCTRESCWYVFLTLQLAENAYQKNSRSWSTLETMDD